MHLEMEPPVVELFQLPEPAFELFGGMSGSIIENEGDRLHLSAQRFRNDLLLHKSLEIGKAFPLSAGSVDFAVSNREASKQVSNATTMITRFREHWFA